MTHRTDHRTMEERWRAMGWHVEWSDKYRHYVLNRLPLRGDGFHDGICRTVDDVEAYVARGRGT